jgi:hypothetical protein
VLGVFCQGVQFVRIGKNEDVADAVSHHVEAHHAQGFAIHIRHNGGGEIDVANFQGSGLRRLRLSRQQELRDAVIAVQRAGEAAYGPVTNAVGASVSVQRNVLGQKFE